MALALTWLRSTSHASDAPIALYQQQDSDIAVADLELLIPPS